MKRKIICIISILTILSCFFFEVKTNAETLQEQKEETQGKRQEAEERLQYVESELSASLVKIQELDDKIREAENQIAEMDSKLIEMTAKVNEITDSLEKVKKEYEQNRKLMEKRLVIMYECGDISYLDLLLHSSNLVEFLSNYYIIEQIVQSDNDILKDIEEEKKEIAEKKEQLEKEKTELKLLKVKQEQTRIIMQNNKVIQESAIAQLSEQELTLQEQIQKYKDEEANLEALIQQASELEYSGDFAGGTMLWPIAKSGTYITSGYGTRTHPIQGVSKFHTGIDIGNAGYGAPVIAAADGVVSLATYYGGYGNCVMINHGNGVATLYGHGQKILTTLGATVKKGDIIMEVGSTGVSTGPHLHFEVRIYGKHTSPLPYLYGTNAENNKNIEIVENTVN